MDYHVFGPVFLRHDDLDTYSKSEIQNKIGSSQTGNQIQYRIFGDSAYAVLSSPHIYTRIQHEGYQDEALENTMSACRQSIEWNYGDLFRFWAFIDFNHSLNIRKSQISMYCSATIILRNSHVTMNGNRTSQFFSCTPPNFEN
jgi:hypothetical protein